MVLKTDYKDDILASEEKRKYQMITNEDGTVSFEDVTEYAQTGDSFGAKDVNDANTEINKKFDSDDVVDPMVTTQTGFAADAYFTKKAVQEVSANLTANIQSVNATLSANKADKASLGTQCTFTLSGTTLTITPR